MLPGHLEVIGLRVSEVFHMVVWCLFEYSVGPMKTGFVVRGTIRFGTDQEEASGQWTGFGFIGTGI